MTLNTNPEHLALLTKVVQLTQIEWDYLQQFRIFFWIHGNQQQNHHFLRGFRKPPDGFQDHINRLHNLVAGSVNVYRQ